MHDCKKCYGQGFKGWIKQKKILCPDCLGTGIRRSDLSKFKESKIIEMQEAKHVAEKSKHSGKEIQS